jgi:hypothetical protein
MGRVDRGPRRWARASKRALCVSAGVAAVIASVFGPAASCAAAEATWREFSWRAPEACPDREVVLHQLEAVLQEHTLALDSADVRGDIERSGASWVLSLDVQVGDERRVRQLSAEKCEDLGDAAAVALVLLLAPARRSDASPTPEGPHAAAQAAPTPVAAPVEIATHDEAADAELDVGPQPAADEDVPRVSWQLGAEAVLDSSTLAGPGLGASLQTQLERADWVFGAYGLLLPAQRREVAPGSSVEFSQLAAGLRLCRVLWRKAWRLDGCVGAEAGSFAARGSELDLTRHTVHDGWLAPSAGAQLGWHALPHATLLGRVEALVPILQESYVINRVDEVHDTPSVTFRVSVGLGFDLL